MKNTIAIVGLLILTGCTHVSVERICSENSDAPSYVTIVRGTNRGLEKELEKIWDEIENDPEGSEAKKDIIDWKIALIGMELEDRGYIIRRRYILPSIIGTAIPEPLQIDNLPEEIRSAASPAVRYWIDNVDCSNPTDSPQVADIKDRKDNFDMWEKFLLSIDPKMMVEQIK